MSEKRLMAKLNCALLFAFLFASLAPSASAEPVTPHEIEIARSFVYKRIGLKSLRVPAVVQTAAAMDAVLRQAGPRGGHAISGYMHGTIYLPVYFTAGTYMPYLVHEMWHYAQFLTGEKFACPRAAERGAYEAQNSFAQKFGYSVHVSENFIARASSCQESL